MDKVNLDLADDYLSGAYNFIWAADKILSSIEKGSAESWFRADDPIVFLIGHAAELTLKAALAYNDFSEDDLKSVRHDLPRLITLCQENHISFDEDFLLWTDAISENFKNHDHRYSRRFSGFPEDKHEELSRLLDEGKGQKEARKYGLVVKSGVNQVSYVAAVKNQIEIINKLNPIRIANASN